MIFSPDYLLELFSICVENVFFGLRLIRTTARCVFFYVAEDSAARLWTIFSRSETLSQVVPVQPNSHS